MKKSSFDKKELNNVLDSANLLEFNNKITFQYIDKQLILVEKQLREKSLELAKIRKEIPDDPSIGIDIFKDGIKNENPYLKTDMLESYQHQIGYFNGCKQVLTEVEYLLTVKKDQYQKDNEESIRISEENKKHFQEVMDKIHEKIKKQ